jgi:hypothetical protein
MILLKQGFEKVMRVLSKEIDRYEENYVKLMFAQKSGQKLQQSSSNTSEF